jgi:KDO2-lipid IV(A) lauroyltransferase
MVSLLPFRLLYLLSDGMYVILYHFIRYRKELVLQNLSNAFPAKEDKELELLAKAFYKHLCDLFLETFKLLTVSKRAMLRHFTFSTRAITLLNELAAQNRNSILVMGHTGNWEWACCSFSLHSQQQLYVIYHPLSNSYFDSLMLKMRTRFGARMIAMNDTFRRMLANRNQLTVTGFVADQTPSNPNAAYWTTFLNQDTPVFRGTELIACKFNYPILYAVVRKMRRGHYEMDIEMLVEQPQQTTDGQITELHTRRLEQDIIAQPETWLWSHRRWKHKRS